MNGLTFSQHILALCDIVLIIAIAIILVAVISGFAGMVASFFFPDDDIMIDDDLREYEFLQEVKNEKNIKEN